MENLVVKHSPGKLIDNGESGRRRTFLDQLSDEEIWLYPFHLTKRVKEKYNLEIWEYISLVLYGDKDYVPRCSTPGCNNPVKYSGRVNWGWEHYCSKSCRASYVAKVQHSDPNSKLSKFTNSTENHIHSWWGKVNRAKISFIRDGKPNDECYLYLGLTSDGKIKFGATSMSLSSGWTSRKSRLRLLSIHQIRKGLREDIANAEANIKFKLGSNVEYLEFSELKRLINIIKELKSN